MSGVTVEVTITDGWRGPKDVPQGRGLMQPYGVRATLSGAQILSLALPSITEAVDADAAEGYRRRTREHRRRELVAAFALLAERACDTLEAFEGG